VRIANITKTWAEIEDAVATALARLAGRFARRGVSECRKSASIIARGEKGREEKKKRKKEGRRRGGGGELLAVLIVTAVVFTKGLSAALAWRGYKAVGGEFMLLLLPIIYYEAKRIILDFVADFVELYRRVED